MNRVLSIFLVAIAALFAVNGCGGSGSPDLGRGSVSGVVFDQTGDIVAGARVFTPDFQTLSNTNGEYVLDPVAGGDQLIRADITVAGVRYVGQNVARVSDRQQSKSVNISVYNVDQIASMQGHVQNSNGDFIEGAKILALAPGATSSGFAYTDSSGYYKIDGLHAGVNYTVQATARTFNSDQATGSLAVGQTTTVDFTLTNETNPTLQPPSNVQAIAWTAPAFDTRSLGGNQAYEAIKRLIDKKRPVKPQTRGIVSNGNTVEVDLDWTPPNSAALLGFGVYRLIGNNDVNVDFYRDPLATFYADNDINLATNTTYGYQVTSLNTSFPDTVNGESSRSPIVDVFTLNPITLDTIQLTPLQFRWFNVANVSQYTVYLFDVYPDLGVSPLWTNTTSGTSLNYTGPSLNIGNVYYYVVVGSTNDGSGNTISTINSFVDAN